MDKFTDDFVCKYLKGETTIQENLVIGTAISLDHEVAKQVLMNIAHLRGITESISDNNEIDSSISDDLIARFACKKNTDEEAKQLLNTAMQDHGIAMKVITAFNIAEKMKKFSPEKREAMEDFFSSLYKIIK